MSETSLRCGSMSRAQLTLFWSPLTTATGTSANCWYTKARGFDHRVAVGAPTTNSGGCVCVYTCVEVGVHMCVEVGVCTCVEDLLFVNCRVARALFVHFSCCVCCPTLAIFKTPGAREAAEFLRALASVAHPAEHAHVSALVVREHDHR